MPTNKRPSHRHGSKQRASSPVAQDSSSSAPNLSHSSELPSALPSASDPPPGKSVRGNAKVAGYAILSTLKGSMKLLKGSCKSFPPLVSVAETLFEVLESIETATKDDPELLEMASDLPRWAIILSSYLYGEPSEDKSKLAENLAEDLRQQAEKLKAQQQLGRMKQRVDPGQRMEELKQCYRHIETSFRQLHADASLSTWKVTQDHLEIARLNELSPSHNARYDSSFSLKIERNGCLENTRATVLEDAHDWIYHAGDAVIYWLNGMAGTGKTTIAYSVCSELEQNGRLGASFFCSRAASDCQDINRILPTIAYQLAQEFYPFRSALCRILAKISNTSQRRLSVQFQHLIQDPLLEVKDILPTGIVVVIDALDECLDPKATGLILKTLFQDAARLPVRFFLTSRPEPSISNAILSQDAKSRSVLHLHNVEGQLVNADIETYLAVSLAEVALTTAQIKQLSDQAGVLFIYATTVARYILSGPAGANRRARLVAVLGSSNRARKKDREIDRLYMTILDEVLKVDELEEHEFDVIKHVLWTVATVKEPVTIATLAGLLEVDTEDVSAALEPLRSVLNIIEGSDIVSTLHASFPEFILDPERSGPWSCHGDSYIATKCFRIMDDQLRFNICGLETSFLFDKDVLDLQDRVANNISPELLYACQYWPEHLRRLEFSTELLSWLNEFLHERLLFWMEALNLNGRSNKGSFILNHLEGWFSGRPEATEILQFVRDASLFVHSFAVHPVHQSTPHIYISCLSLAPKKSKVWEVYRERMQGLPWLGGTGISQWHAQLAATHTSLNQTSKAPGDHTNSLIPDPDQPHTGEVRAVAFSPDGTRIVSSSCDKTIRMWHSCNGTPLAAPVRGHTDGVMSIGFSPDGTRIVSGSCDTTVRVWDSFSGTPLTDPLEGHTDTVMSVAFSPDSTHIVSGSLDTTVRVWDSCSGTPFADPFKGHTDGVMSVAFSPDSTRIVSGSLDNTIRMWDSHNGTLPVGSFEGHTDMVMSVAFSPDGARIVSGSRDTTIRVWDSYDGTPLAGPCRGHTDKVMSVAFSPGGTRIVSGSCDATVRVWDSRSGAPLAGPFKGHTDMITSVAFSPDDTRIVSGSCDTTVRVWDWSQSLVIGSWTIDDSGWVRDSRTQMPILWVPQHLKKVFPSPPNVLVIGERFVGLRWDKLRLDKYWHQYHRSTDLVDPY